jgi:hypothetical protein
LSRTPEYQIRLARFPPIAAHSKQELAARKLRQTQHGTAPILTKQGRFVSFIPELVWKAIPGKHSSILILTK